MKIAVEFAILTLATLLICSLVFMQDHEFETYSDLVQRQNLPSYLIYGTPLLVLMVGLSFFFERRYFWGFLTMAIGSGLFAGTVIWILGASNATFEWPLWTQLFHMAILWFLMTCLISLPVLGAKRVTRSLFPPVPEAGNP